MKKMLLIFLAATITFTICACSKVPTDSNTVDDTTSKVTSSVAEQTASAKLPDNFVVSKYDEEYFQPETNDYIIVSYELPITLYVPEWFNYLGQMAYGYADIEKQSTAKVTQMTYFDGEKQVGIKIRLEYKSVKDAMTAAIIRDKYIIPAKMGLPNKSDDSLVTAEYFEDGDIALFVAFPSTMYNGYTAEYKGHFDNLRYFEIVCPNNESPFSNQFWHSAHVTDNEEIGNIYMEKISYPAGELVTVSRLTAQHDEDWTVKMQLFSSKRSYTPPEPISSESNESVLKEIISLPKDLQHFTPLTEDYLIVVYSNNETYDFKTGDPQESINQQIATLFSFDDNGNLVQECARSYNKSYITDNTFFATSLQIEKENTYYSSVIDDRENGVIYSERQMGEAGSNYKR